jgi:hypothetical protein
MKMPKLHQVERDINRALIQNNCNRRYNPDLKMNKSWLRFFQYMKKA